MKLKKYLFLPVAVLSMLCLVACQDNSDLSDNDNSETNYSDDNYEDSYVDEDYYDDDSYDDESYYNDDWSDSDDSYDDEFYESNDDMASTDSDDSDFLPPPTPTPVLPETFSSEGLIFGDYLYEGSGEKMVIGYTGDPVHLKIPEEYEGELVKGIDEGAFRDCQSLVSVSIPPELYAIGYEAFAGCSNLTYVIFDKNGVHNFGGGTFRDCTNLIYISLPPNADLDYEDFYNCTSLTSIEYPYYSCYIFDSTFYNCVNLEYLSLARHVSFIEDNAFIGCDKLTIIATPDTEAENFANANSIPLILVPDEVLDPKKQ